MAWKVLNIDRNTDDNNIVTAYVHWTVVVGSETTESFLFERRLTTNAAGRANFITAARAALAAYQTKLTQINNAKAILETELNS